MLKMVLLVVEEKTKNLLSKTKKAKKVQDGYYYVVGGLAPELVCMTTVWGEPQTYVRALSWSCSTSSRGRRISPHW
jgi:hypothetical protein